VCVLNGCIKI